MTAQTLNPDILFKVVEQVLEKREDLLLRAIELYIEKNKSSESKDERMKNLEKIVDKHFDKYDDVFKALA